MDDAEWLAKQFETYRGHLREVTYRMLGSLSEADDAVQEAWLRLCRSDASGTDIFHTPTGRVKLTAGTDAVRCLSFSGKVLRWYTDCCRTPIGNTAGAGFRLSVSSTLS
jgi:hypothetical protein